MKRAIRSEECGRITVACRCCKGQGRKLLPIHLCAVLHEVCLHGQWTSRDLADHMKLEISAACNRLVALYNLGLVAREMRAHPSGGQEFVYRPAVLPEEEIY